MPTVYYRGERIECERGANLRDVLLETGLSPHNGMADTLNCGGHATCGTCAVRLEGDVSEPTAAERRRLSVPPLRGREGLRLACQTEVLGDLEVRKGEGFWGQREPSDDGRAESDEQSDAPESTG
ncbi:2Fe-2S iron-sulfur cluster binding domain-containing protein [Halobiforma haloterrestris]|uniref:2Fe-2S iron-sulfur cluster binding domain-containing protein n=1 Tax=Natronobacterium haloterrestre TaxID=148448 RepID=A0A1I1HKB4_NATHA|nr:2Fe-2S iron-sulfur cluster-binding protein [Halobiforma haloterrestris]SFC24281.1 2Fe-2S iron-sulfur cluster binding domain-containing protein [Halobiforma haloterrestris]